ncbi:hypothetical protein J4Q44_G00340080 [Coregonus suidteri]|uniref:Uncharacterized protein n=1 Tax=Coregonus suidteri TaxID=861788 RepID=A0AAN8KVS9_9TELE
MASPLMSLSLLDPHASYIDTATCIVAHVGTGLSTILLVATLTPSGLTRILLPIHHLILFFSSSSSSSSSPTPSSSASSSSSSSSSPSSFSFTSSPSSLAVASSPSAFSPSSSSSSTTSSFFPANTFGSIILRMCLTSSSLKMPMMRRVLMSFRMGTKWNSTLPPTGSLIAWLPSSTASVNMLMALVFSS